VSPSIPNLIVRRAEVGDAAAIAACFTESVHGLAREHYDERQRAAWAPPAPDPAEWAQKFEGRTVLVAVVDQVVRAFLVYSDDGHIGWLYTAPQAARRGLAARLHARAEHALRGLGRVRLFTEASLVAQPFFTRLGYRIVTRESVERRGVSLDRFRMEKRLDADSPRP